MLLKKRTQEIPAVRLQVITFVLIVVLNRGVEVVLQREDVALDGLGGADHILVLVEIVLAEILDEAVAVGGNGSPSALRRI